MSLETEQRPNLAEELPDEHYEFRWGVHLERALDAASLVIPGWPSYFNTNLYRHLGDAYLEIRLDKTLAMYVKLYDNNADTACPKYTETLMGHRAWQSVIGNSDWAYVAELGPTYRPTQNCWKLPFPEYHEFINDLLTERIT